MSVLARAHWPALRAKMAALHPITMRLTRFLDLAINGEISPTITTTGWPEPTSVVIPYTEQDTLLKSGRGYYMYAADGAPFERHQRHDILDWSTDFLASGVPPCIGDVIIRQVEERGLLFTRHTSYLMRATVDTLPPLDRYTLPDGYFFDKLEVANAEAVVSSWPYCLYYSLDDIKNEVLAHIKSYPTLAVRTLDGGLAGWVLQRYSGDLGFLHVNPPHRGRGLAKALTCTLSHNVIAKDPRGEVFVDVVMDNAPALALHEACGFSIVPGGDSDWIHVLLSPLSQPQGQ